MLYFISELLAVVHPLLDQVGEMNGPTAHLWTGQAQGRLGILWPISWAFMLDR